MAAVPHPEHTTAQAILGWWEANAEDGHRPHLGASLIGHECDRALWLTFRWVARQKFGGRLLRLFDDGKRAEPRFVQELRGIGAEVWEFDAEGGQFRVSALGGHFGGSVDAVVQGIPEAPKTPHVAEFKTSNDKLFKVLQAKGVREAKPMHFAQMTVYMGLLQLDRALYLVENKNDASVYSERVEFDRAAFDAIMARAERIITASAPPLRLSEDPAWFGCKWCNFHPVCHGTQAPEVNCRTCARSTPITSRPGAEWECGQPDAGVIPIAAQRTGCPDHLYIPPLLDRLGTPTDGGEDYVAYTTPAGAEFINGPAPNFSSLEIAACKHVQILADPVVQDIKHQVPTARLVGTTAFDDMPSDLDDAPVKADPPARVEARRKAQQTLDSLIKASDVPY